MSLNVVIIGLSITSSWGNGHATTYRSLTKGLSGRGHRVTFFERDQPWYRDHRDLSHSPHADIVLYRSARELFLRHAAAIRSADLVILGSYSADGVEIGEWLAAHARGVFAFYDIDTPVTLSGLEKGTIDYISRALVPRFDLYLSFTGGPTLERLEREFGARRARALYCAVDAETHRPHSLAHRWEMGYLGTYSPDRQATLDRLLIDVATHLPARDFVVAGAGYRGADNWPANVAWRPHVAPDAHAGFYGAQRFTLNVTRADMIAAGYSPSVRLFEAAACGVPIVTDAWPGLATLFTPGEEILVAADTRDVLAVLQEIPEETRQRIAQAARRRVLAAHTGAARAAELEGHVDEAVRCGRPRAKEIYA